MEPSCGRFKYYSPCSKDPLGNATLRDRVRSPCSLAGCRYSIKTLIRCTQGHCSRPNFRWKSREWRGSESGWYTRRKRNPNPCVVISLNTSLSFPGSIHRWGPPGTETRETHWIQQVIDRRRRRSAHYYRIVICGKSLESRGPGASKDTEGKACELGMQWHRVWTPVEPIPICLTVGKPFSNLRLSAFSGK